VPCRRTEVPRSTFWGSVLSRAPRASLPPARPFAGAAPPRRSRVVPEPAGSPLLGFLLPRTQLRRVPLLHHALPRGRTCGTRIARPSSVPSSGFLPLSTVSASTRRIFRSFDLARPFGPRRSPWPPTLRGLLSCRSRPWSAPPELSLPGEPCPLSWAFCFLAGSLSDIRRRSACRSFAAAFALRASPLPLAPAVRRTRDA